MENIWIELLIGSIIGAFIFCFIAAYVFGVSRFKRCQDAQIRLLSEIALKQGVDPYAVKEILTKVDKPD